VNYTRPDMAYAVNRLCRYTNNPSHEHWKALDRVMGYLRGTSNYSLHFTGFPNFLECYCDANWISDSQDVKSTSGYVFLLGGAAVSWKSCKQTVIARSTMESEIIALDTACTEAEWLRDLMQDIPFVSSPLSPIAMNCDCRTAIEKCSQENADVHMNRHLKV
jgi:hypothetical protein